jgi:hypothetical protein
VNRQLQKRWGNWCSACGHIQVRRRFRCEKCKAPTEYETFYVICPSETPCGKVKVSDLQQHLEEKHAGELAQFFVEHIALLYDPNSRVRYTRAYTAERIHERRVRKQPGD